MNVFVCVRYDPECNTWSVYVPSLSSPRSRVCVLEMDGCLITLGGFDGMTCINTVERSKYTCTLQRNGCLEMWSSNTYTLVFCGVGMTRWRTPGLSWHQCWGTGHLHQPLSWTVRFTLWEELMETSHWIQVHKHTYMCRFEIKILNTHSSALVERFDPFEGCWSLCPTMSTAREASGCAVFLGCLYVAGGRDELGLSLSTVEKYNPDTLCWSPVRAMNNKRFQVWGNKSYSSLSTINNSPSCHFKPVQRIWFGNDSEVVELWSLW